MLTECLSFKTKLEFFLSFNFTPDNRVLCEAPLVRYNSDITRFVLPDIFGCPVLIFRLGVLNFPKERVADYRCIFRTL